MPRQNKNNGGSTATSPDHYKQGGLEVITIWQKKLTHEEFRGACKANITKYIFRAENKNGLEDYKKAAVYLNWLIEAEEKEAARIQKELDEVKQRKHQEYLARKEKENQDESR